LVAAGQVAIHGVRAELMGARHEILHDGLWCASDRHRRWTCRLPESSNDPIRHDLRRCWSNLSCSVRVTTSSAMLHVGRSRMSTPLALTGSQHRDHSIAVHAPRLKVARIGFSHCNHRRRHDSTSYRVVEGGDREATKRFSGEKTKRCRP